MLMQHRRMKAVLTMRRGTTAVIAVGAMLALSSCVLRETSDYVVQPAPPTGVHVTIKLGPTTMLKFASDIIAGGGNIDSMLRDFGIPTRCDGHARTRYGGDLCAFEILQDMDVSGSLIDNAANQLYWSDAINDDELDDFRNDALARVRLVKDVEQTICLHATIRNVGDWPVEWRDTNWTTRDRASDSKCR
jgi:hypothetical protein